MAAGAGTDESTDLRRTLEGLLGVAATEGNRVEVLRNGDEIFPAMLDAVRASRATVDFLTFIYWKGTIGEEFAEAFAERARAGVRVRVLLDAFGCHRMDSRLIAAMRAAGVHVESFHPVSNWRVWELNHRTHRKLLVCDEEVGFTGGIGIADQWRGDARTPGEWRDTHFRIRGPAVDGLRAAFVDNWAETGRPVLSEADRFPIQPAAGDSRVLVIRGEAETGWSDITTVVRTLLARARHHVRITTAYFAPDDDTCALLCETARRGVEVDLLLPGPHADKRFCQVASEAQYACLLDAGVRVWCFQPSMLHAKILTVDGVLAHVGSANFNYRSLALDEEVTLAVFDPAVVERLDRDFEDDLARSEAIDPARWGLRHPVQRLGETTSRLLSRYL